MIDLCFFFVQNHFILTSKPKKTKETETHSKMNSLKSILSILMILACFVTVSFAKRKDDEDATAKAIRDLKVGMAGLQEAASNPAVLAQLMQDLQVSHINLQLHVIPLFFFLTLS